MTRIDVLYVRYEGAGLQGLRGFYGMMRRHLPYAPCAAWEAAFRFRHGSKSRAGFSIGLGAAGNELHLREEASE